MDILCYRNVPYFLVAEESLEGCWPSFLLQLHTTYKTLCCDVEMVIDKGHVFPDCPKHPRLTTAWKAINDTDKNMPRAVELNVNPSKSSDKGAA